MKPTIQLQKSLLLLIASALFGTYATAQSIPNGNFEDWEMIGETLEPTGWNTSNYSDNGQLPISAHRTESACEGEFALKLTSTAPSLEGPGPGFALQSIELDEAVTSATFTFSYAADTLVDGAFGRVDLIAFDVFNGNEIVVALETIEFYASTDGCIDETMTIDSPTPFNKLHLEMRAEPYYTGLSTEGLSVIRFDNLNLEMALSVNELDLSGQFTTMPNPTTGLLNFKHENLRIYDIRIMDLSGKMLRQIPVSSQSADLSDLPSGTYLLKVIAEKGVAVKKVVKE